MASQTIGFVNEDGFIRLSLGKKYFELDRLLSNFNALIKEIVNLKPKVFETKTARKTPTKAKITRF